VECFIRERGERGTFASRERLDSRDALALAREFLTMSQSELSARLKGSPMQRAKRRGIARNAAVC
jgi:hypothetical protein